MKVIYLVKFYKWKILNNKSKQKYIYKKKVTRFAIYINMDAKYNKNFRLIIVNKIDKYKKIILLQYNILILK